MNYLEQIQCGIDYIEDHLDQSISIHAIAQKAGMSQWHFQRIFKGLTGDTVKTYIRSRRLGHALNLLLHTDQRIIDIALSADFESQESFTRAFKTAFHITPAQYRKAGQPYPMPQKPRFNKEYLQHINHGMNTAPDIYLQPEMHLVGMQTSYFGTESEKNNLGEKLPPLWAAFLPRLPEVKSAIAGTCYGVIRQLEENDDELEYFCAIAVEAITDIPPGMVALTIPPSTYAKFTHKGAVGLIDHTVNYIYATWLLQSRKTHANTADLEFYGAAYDPTSNESIMHYAIPIM